MSGVPDVNLRIADSNNMSFVANRRGLLGVRFQDDTFGGSQYTAEKVAL